MAFEKCDNVECSGCYRVDSADWHGDAFSGVAYRGEYALLTVALPEVVPFPEVAIGVALGIFPEWISAAIFVGNGSLDEAIDLADGNEDEPIWLAWEVYEGDNPEVQHEMLADSMSLFVGDAVKVSTKEFVDSILVDVTKG